MDIKLFQKIFRSILILSIIMLSIGCGGGGGGGSSTPTATTYKLFPDGYFTAGYQESYNLTGTDTGGGKFTGTYLLQTESPTTIDSEQAIPVTGLFSLTNTVTKATLTETGGDFYSDNANDRKLLGSVNTTFSDETIAATSLTAIPQSAEIGEFGALGSYSWSSGDLDTTNWRLTQASNGRANLIISTTTTDNGGTIISTDEETYVIDSNGIRYSLKIVMYSADDGVTMTLSGQ